MSMCKSVKVLNSLKILLLTAVIALSAFPDNAMGKIGLSVEPDRIEITGRTGKASKLIRLTNTGDEVLSVTLTVKEIAQNLNGAFIFSDVRFPRSAAAFIRLNTNVVELWPDQIHEVNIDVDVPGNTPDGGLYAAVLVNYKTISKGEESETVIPVMMVLPGRQIVKGEISEVFLKQSAKGEPIEVTTIFKNSGNVHFAIAGKIRVKDQHEKEIAAVPVESGIILPGYSVQLKAILNPDMFYVGSYTAESVLQSGAFSNSRRKVFQILQPLEMAQPRISLAELRVANVEKFKPITFQFNVVNEGNMGLFAEKGDISITDKATGIVAASTSFKGGAVPVKTSKKYGGSFPGGLPTGEYSIIAKVDCGMGDPAVTETTFKVYEFTPVVKGEITGFSVDIDATGIVPSFESKLTFKNSGNMPIYLEGMIEVKDSTDAVVDKIRIARTEFGAGIAKVLVSKWESNLPRGIYSAGLSVAFDEKNTANANTTIVVNP